eukprot:scaffold306897_cov46-Attheya_sp.AAC.1
MVGFAVGTALGRAAKLVLISSLYVGRMDTPLLAPGVGVGPLADHYPMIFRKDILAQEAHRHPYLGVIGKIYLMKLRHGKAFVSRAGYCYRLIFAVALMPWLRKYRVMARPNLSLDNKGVDSDDTDGANGAMTLTGMRAGILSRTSILFETTKKMWKDESGPTGGDNARDADKQEVELVCGTNKSPSGDKAGTEIEELRRQLASSQSELKQLRHSLEWPLSTAT